MVRLAEAHAFGDHAAQPDHLDLRRCRGNLRLILLFRLVRRGAWGGGGSRRDKVLAQNPSAGTRADDRLKIDARLACAPPVRRRSHHPPLARRRRRFGGGRGPDDGGRAPPPPRAAAALVQLEHDERRTDRDFVARRSADRHHPAAHGRRHFHRRLVGHHFDDELIFGHCSTGLGMPGDDLSIHRPFAQVRHLEYELAHADSMTALSAVATRAWPGKYSHSKACG